MNQIIFTFWHLTNMFNLKLIMVDVVLMLSYHQITFVCSIPLAITSKPIVCNPSLSNYMQPNAPTTTNHCLCNYFSNLDEVWYCF